MKEYKMTEANALDMVRQKSLECEKEHWAAVAELEAAGPLSANLYRYLDMTRSCHAGTMLWSALADRYNTNTIYQDTPSPLEDGSPKREDEHHINRDHFRDGSSNIRIDHLMTGDDPQDGGSAVSEANRKEGGRPHPVDGTLESHQSGDTYEEPGTESDLIFHRQILLAPYEYVAATPTEKVREVFIDGLNSWLQLPEKSLNCIRSIVVKLYTAALMLDDVQGGSILRRGMPSAQVVYGASQTINSAGYVQICVFAEAAGLSNPGAVSIVCEELTNLYTGHSMDLFWKFHSHCPTEEEYYEMVDGKTGGFFRLILRLMQAESPVLKYDFTSPLTSAPLRLIPARAFEPALETFITSLGRYFHVRNEYENLASSKDVHRERFYEDLDEGKMSLPFIHSLQNSSGGDKARIKGIFKTRGPSGLSPEVKEFVIKHLSERTASLLYVRDVLKGLASAIADALTALEEIFGIENPLLRGLMAKLGG
ncbi:MAG: hypothetical protein LQ349_009355 [Xanthoria aureola]|nr:MAG: hypothetical protein LQ349_009355 [Xanthoria aureola]